MEKGKNRHIAARLLLYALGMVILASGIVLNTKVTLGVAPIVSVANCVSELTGVILGNMTLAEYSIFVVAEIVIHLIMRREDMKAEIIRDVLQLPVTVLFTRVINLFSIVMPTFETAFPGTFWGGVWGRGILLLVGVVLTGFGAALALRMKIVPNPGEGIVQAVADISGLKTGTAKNFFDLGCFLLTVTLGLVFAGRLIGVGIGTVVSVIGVGRVMWAFDRLFGRSINEKLFNTAE